MEAYWGAHHPLHCEPSFQKRAKKTLGISTIHPSIHPSIHLCDTTRFLCRISIYIIFVITFLNAHCYNYLINPWIPNVLHFPLVTLWTQSCHFSLWLPLEPQCFIFPPGCPWFPIVSHIPLVTPWFYKVFNFTPSPFVSPWTPNVFIIYFPLVTPWFPKVHISPWLPPDEASMK